MKPLNLARRRQFLSFAVGAWSASALPGARAAAEPGAAAPLHWRERVLLGFGTTLWLRAAHADAARADTALSAGVAVIRRIEAQMSLFDTGEWTALGQAPRAQPWTLGIANPRSDAATPTLLARLHADGRAIATSSDAHTTFSADRRDHHIIDPRSARSPRELASVTVAARSCALADALTKVAFMGGWSGALPLARRWGVDILVVDKSGRWCASPGLKLA